MKPYVKPTLTAFSLSGNEVLCGSCAAGMKLSQTPRIAKLILDGIDPTLDDDGITYEDFDGVFSKGDGCKKFNPSFDTYCKHVSTGALVFWS